MQNLFEELDYQATPMGELVLQRRRLPAFGERDIYEVKLGGDYLMSSPFVEAEVALADRGLVLLDGEGWEVVVGGLGLGYTACATLNHPQLQRLIVVEALAPVIDWHRRALVPNGRVLNENPRAGYYHGDFFALARGPGFDPDTPGQCFDAVLLDIDHTRTQLLNPAHADLYTETGMQRLRAMLKPGGVFALWSNEAPDEAFLAILARVFSHAEGQVIEFDNPLQDKTARNGLYLARRD